MIEIITNANGSGDYIVVKHNGEIVHSGHEISHYDLAYILDQVTGSKSLVVELTDEEMEECSF